jgi:4a-hydroxytetrahydrobiopterin dehydratase
LRQFATLGGGAGVDKPPSAGADRFDVEPGLGHIRPMSAPLSPEEIQRALAGLPGWTFERDALAKTFQFASFRAALAFMVRAGFEAEELNHHPEWTNVYQRVSVRLNTHDAGDKVTAKDVTLAQRFERVSAG